MSHSSRGWFLIDIAMKISHNMIQYGFVSDFLLRRARVNVGKPVVEVIGVSVVRFKNFGYYGSGVSNAVVLLLFCWAISRCLSTTPHPIGARGSYTSCTLLCDHT